MHAHAIVKTAERETAEVTDSRLATGLAYASLVGAAEGSVHLEIGHSVLAAGGRIEGHLHPYEESFFLLDGTVVLRTAGADHLLGPGDYGVVPLGTPHAWRNVGDEPARWVRFQAPRPRSIGDNAEAVFPVAGMSAPATADRPDYVSPAVRRVGHFSADELPAPGPLSIRGAHNYAVRNISVRMMVDDTADARHHVVFAGQMAADPTRRDGVPPAHYHAFEEAYYFLSGSARAFLEGGEHRITAGDIVFAGVNATHAFVPDGDAPLRWIEVQAPRPPAQDSMFFVEQWRALDDRGMRA